MTQTTENTVDENRIPPGQQLVAPGKWPVIGEREPAHLGPWSLAVIGEIESPQEWTLEQLKSLPQTTIQLDIHCVTRWSKLDNQFSGILLEDLLSLVRPSKDAKYISFVARSERGHSTSLVLEQAVEQGTLIALNYADKPLEVGHGGPIRNIVPGRYFYKSVKWLERIELLREDRLGMWEAESGYHNHADPWKEERYMTPTIDKRTAAELIRSRDFSGRDLRSIDACDRDLTGLVATEAQLRDARFDRAKLDGARFTKANLSNAHFVDAALSGASFREADVEGADFTGADLRGVDFTGASVIGASFMTEANGKRHEAIIDETTCLPEDVITPLFPEQLAFVKSKLTNNGT